MCCVLKANDEDGSCKWRRGEFRPQGVSLHAYVIGFWHDRAFQLCLSQP